jgi:hypothetical protein
VKDHCSPWLLGYKGVGTVPEDPHGPTGKKDCVHEDYNYPWLPATRECTLRSLLPLPPWVQKGGSENLEDQWIPRAREVGLLDRSFRGMLGYKQGVTRRCRLS